jgi:mannose-6-phosphate isomerase-like protein (cupin superfamily)
MTHIKSYKIHGTFSLFTLALCLMSAAISAKTLALADPLKAGWKGNNVCENLYEDTEKRVLRCTFPPNVGHERHFHISHFGYAISGGRVKITDDKGVREVTLSTGSSYTSNGVAWHEIVNIGDTTVTYLIVENKTLG